MKQRSSIGPCKLITDTLQHQAPAGWGRLGEVEEEGKKKTMMCRGQLLQQLVSHSLWLVVLTVLVGVTLVVGGTGCQSEWSSWSASPLLS